jgi:hypothetical protein
MLIGAAIAGTLLWVATQFEMDSTGGYWAFMGLAAAAGLVLAVGQIAGGWTKWGKPRVTGGAFLLGFLPALAVGAWVLLAAQPEGSWMQADAESWLGEIGLTGTLETLAETVLPAIAFALGLLFGYTFDTAGGRVADTAPGPLDDRAERWPEAEAEERTAETDERERRIEDEPVTAERSEVHERAEEREEERVDGDYREPDRSLVGALTGRGERESEAGHDGHGREVESRRDDDEPRTTENVEGGKRRGLFRRK